MKSILFNAKYKKNINAFVALAIAILCFFTVLSSGIMAAGEPEVEDFNSPNAFEGDGFKEAAWFFVYNVFGDNLTEDTRELLIFDPVGGYGGSSVMNSAAVSIWALVTTVHSYACPLAYCLIVLYFLLDVIEKSTHEQMSIEHFFRSSIKLVVAVFFIENSLEILEALLNFSNALTNEITSRVGSIDFTDGFGESVLESYYRDIDNASGITGVFLCIGFVLQLILPFVVIWVCSLVTTLVVWSRAIEIGVRGALAPLGMADLFTEGTKGAGFRYLKKYLAVLLQGAIIMLILFCYQAINAGLTSGAASMEPIKVAFSQCTVSLTVMSMLLKTQNLANDLVGV